MPESAPRTGLARFRNRSMPSLRGGQPARRPPSPPPPVPAMPSAAALDRLSVSRVLSASCPDPTKMSPYRPLPALPRPQSQASLPSSVPLARQGSMLPGESAPPPTAPMARSTTSLHSSFSDSSSEGAASSKFGRGMFAALRAKMGRKAPLRADASARGTLSAPGPRSPAAAAGSSPSRSPARAGSTPPAQISSPRVIDNGAATFATPLLPLSEAQARVRRPTSHVPPHGREAARLHLATVSPTISARGEHSEDSESAYSADEVDALPTSRSMETISTEEGFPFPRLASSRPSPKPPRPEVRTVHQIESLSAPIHPDNVFRAADLRMQYEMLWSLQFEQSRPRLRRVLLHAAQEIFGASRVYAMALQAGVSPAVAASFGEQQAAAGEWLRTEISGVHIRAARLIADALFELCYTPLGDRQVQGFFSAALELGDLSYRRRELGRTLTNVALPNATFYRILSFLGATNAADHGTHVATHYFGRLHGIH